MAQVISNSGAAISITSGAAITSKDIQNGAAGRVGNNGTVELRGDYINQATASTSGDGNYTLKGNWTDYGLFNSGNSTVEFNGNTKQKITHGSAGETFYKLIINNSADTITQIAPIGSNLNVLNNLMISDGTLYPGDNTKNLNVYGNAGIEGSLSFSNQSTQTSSIVGNLSGLGQIDMRGGTLPHILNLSGATNDIGELMTSDTSSIVNYRGTNQTVFKSINYRNLVLSISGTKTLQGNSAVGENLRIAGSATVFDLGSTSSLNVQDSASLEGTLKFNGDVAKTVNIGGDLAGTGAIDMSGGNLAHLLNLRGATNKIGLYSSGNESTVDYQRDDIQTVFGSDFYRNLKISGDGEKTLNGIVEASGILSMLAGNINSDAFILKISNSDLDAIKRISGTIIGKLQRRIGIGESDYLYPIGSGSSYNPMNINFLNLNAGGPLTAEFKPNDIGDVGLPKVDSDGDEIWKSLPEGYWRLKADSPMSYSNYDVNLNYDGFDGVAQVDKIDPSCRIIKSTDGGGFTLEGNDGSITETEIKRNGLLSISGGSTDFAIGKGRPNIVTHPIDNTICEGLNALFKVVSNRQGTVGYHWQLDTGTGFGEIPSGNPVYSNPSPPELKITIADSTMNGYVYQVIVTDEYSNNNYSSEALFVVNTNPFVDSVRIDSASCRGVANGSVYPNIIRGTPNYIYRWNKYSPTGPVESTVLDLINASVDYHYLTIIDANGCKFPNNLTPSKANEFKVPPLDDMAINKGFSRFGIDNVYEISCFGKTDGKIDVYVDGGKKPFIYDWMNLSTGEILSDNDSAVSNLSAGTYVVTVTDGAGCQGYKDFTLFEPDPISVTRTNPKYAGDFDISCFGRSDGIINLNISGGHTADNSLNVTHPTLYSWEKDGFSGFSDTRDLNSLSTGEYVLTVEDTLNCFTGASFAYTLISPDEFILDSVTIEEYNGYQVSCINSSDGIINPYISGGFGSYDYSWSSANGSISGAATPGQEGITAGDYHLDVVDEINCPAAWDFVITEPDTIAIDPVLHSKNNFEISCFGGDDGSIELNTFGGVTTADSPYEFTWTSSDGSGFILQDENQSDLTSGTYSVTVKDANDCVSSWDFVLTSPEKILTRVDSTSIACFSANTGAADLTISGGVMPYTYLWNNGSTDQDINSLYEGIYFVDIFDANNCPATDTTAVTQSPEILISLDVPTPYNGRMVSCNGVSDATVNSEVTGGRPPYNYSWRREEWSQSNQTDSTLTNMPAGLYLLSITDFNECVKNDSIEVIQPLKLRNEVFATDPTCAGKKDGQITIIVQGGTPTYSIVWDVNGQNGQTIDSIGDGHYDVMITDLNLCKDSAYANLIAPDSIKLNNPVEGDGLTNPDCPDIFNGSLTYEISGGTQPYEMFLYNLGKIHDSIPLGGGTTMTVSDLEQGTYRFKITDNQQCEFADTSVLKAGKGECITVPNAFTPNNDGVNDTWMIEQIDIYPNAQIDIYNRWGEAVFHSSKGYTKPWDGTFNGRILPIDSYFYIIDLKNGRDAISGDITIIK